MGRKKYYFLFNVVGSVQQRGNAINIKVNANAVNINAYVNSVNVSFFYIIYLFENVYLWIENIRKTDISIWENG